MPPEQVAPSPPATAWYGYAHTCDAEWSAEWYRRRFPEVQSPEFVTVEQQCIGRLRGREYVMRGRGVVVGGQLVAVLRSNRRGAVYCEHPGPFHVVDAPARAAGGKGKV